MKKSTGVLIFLFLTGMILGTTQPAMLYAGETPGGDIWGPFVDPGPYPLLRLKGPLSIYYEFAYYEDGTTPILCDDGDQFAYMYYTVRLNKEFDIRPNPDLYTFQETNGTCLNNWLFQGKDVIKPFLGTVVYTIFPNAKSWKLKSITKAQYHDDLVSRAFVADIEIAVVVRGR